MRDGQPVHVFRVDKFVVPIDARDEFVRELRRTHDLLAEQPGFVQDFLLEQSGGPGEFNFVTIAVWDNQEAIENARDAVSAMHEQSKFDPEELFTRRDISADIGTYELIGGNRTAPARTSANETDPDDGSGGGVPGGSASIGSGT